jgi:broad specificity phosphatase PhoE
MPRADRTSDEPAPTTDGRRTERRTGTRRRPPPPTVVVLVRHGVTTTTGHELPGRAPGLHLSDAGREQAGRVAARIATMAGLTPDGASPPGATPGSPGAAAAPAGDGASGTGSDGATADGASPGGAPAGRRGRGSRSSRGAKAPAGPRVTAVYASPLERTRETAAPIARALGHEVVLDDGLLELDMGEWTGLELKVARKRKEWSTIQRYPSGFTFPGGESFLAMQARITATLDRLRSAHPGQTIVAVSHADPIRAAVAHAMGTHLDLFQRVVVSPCSLTVIAYGDEGPTVLTVNDTAAGGALVPS